MADIIFNTQSADNDAVFGRLQAPIRFFLEKRSEAYETQSMLPTLFVMDTSTHFAEALTSQTGMEDWEPVGENGAYPETGMKDGFKKILTHMTFKQSFKITQEAVEDAQLQDYKRQPRKFIDAYHRTREKFGAALYGAAFNGEKSVKMGKRGMSFSTTTADDLPLFSSQHKAAGRGSKQSNVCSDAFSVAALDAAECAMQDFRDDDGEVLGLAPDTILIPNYAEIKRAVFAAIGADKDPNSAHNGFNYQYGRWDVIIWPYLNQYIRKGDTTPWALVDSNYIKDAMAAPWFDRIKLTVKSDIDPNTDANTWRGRARWSAGFNDWRYIFGGGITGADALVTAS